MLAFIAFLAAVFFFALAVFSIALAGIPLVDAGLLSLAIGFVLGSVPVASRVP